MEQADILGKNETGSSTETGRTTPCKVVAAGLFGHSIRYGRVQSFAPMAGYVRELEQLPNFTPPSVDRFVEQYVRSTIGVTKSSS